MREVEGLSGKRSAGIPRELSRLEIRRLPPRPRPSGFFRRPRLFVRVARQRAADKTRAGAVIEHGNDDLPLIESLKRSTRDFIGLSSFPPARFLFPADAERAASPSFTERRVDFSAGGRTQQLAELFPGELARISSQSSPASSRSHIPPRCSNPRRLTNPATTRNRAFERTSRKRFGAR